LSIYYICEVNVAIQRDANTTTPPVETFRMRTASLPSKAQTIQIREATMLDMKGGIAVMDIRASATRRHCRDQTLFAMAKRQLWLPHGHISLTKMR